MKRDADPPHAEPPPEIEMRRDPWWAGGRWRAAPRRFPRFYDNLPFWARFGFMTPIQPTTLLWSAAVGCAAIGLIAILTAVFLHYWTV